MSVIVTGAGLVVWAVSQRLAGRGSCRGRMASCFVTDLGHETHCFLGGVADAVERLRVVPGVDLSSGYRAPGPLLRPPLPPGCPAGRPVAGHLLRALAAQGPG